MTRLRTSASAVVAAPSSSNTLGHRPDIITVRRSPNMSYATATASFLVRSRKSTATLGREALQVEAPTRRWNRAGRQRGCAQAYRQHYPTPEADCAEVLQTSPSQSGVVMRPFDMEDDTQPDERREGVSTHIDVHQTSRASNSDRLHFVSGPTSAGSPSTSTASRSSISRK